MGKQAAGPATNGLAASSYRTCATTAAAHTAAFDELLRVADEVRVFPLVTLEGRWSPHVEPVRTHLERAGFAVELRAVDYEFQKADGHAGNRMLRVYRRVL